MSGAVGLALPAGVGLWVGEDGSEAAGPFCGEDGDWVGFVAGVGKAGWGGLSGVFDGGVVDEEVDGIAVGVFAVAYEEDIMAAYAQEARVDEEDGGGTEVDGGGEVVEGAVVLGVGGEPEVAGDGCVLAFEGAAEEWDFAHFVKDEAGSGVGAKARRVVSGEGHGGSEGSTAHRVEVGFGVLV